MFNSVVSVQLKRRVQIRYLFIVAVFALCASQSAHAQSYSTYTVDGIASSIDGQWYIGADGSFNTLTVNNAGWLSVNGGTTLGYQAGANHNSALVTDTGSVWDNQGDLVVGDAGARNRLTVANGGMVNNYNGWIGGSGAQQAQSLLQLANADSSLQQSITRLSTGLRINTAADDAAGLSLNTGSNNTGLNAGANNNSVRVTGAGSTWNNNGDLVVGYSGAGNKLTVANGGMVNNNNGWIGGNGTQQSQSVLQQANVAQLANADDAAGLSLSSGLQINSGGDNAAGLTPSTANNNSVRVTGANSTWNNNGDLVVGSTGAGNKLTVANGGVVNNNNGWIGGSVVQQQSQSVLQLFRGDDASGLQQSANSLSSGSQINSGSDNAATPSTANNNSVRVTGAGSTWNNNGDLVVGYSGASNKLTIANGGVVNNNNGWIGGSAVQQSQSILQQANVLQLANADDAAGLSSGSRINSGSDDAAGLSVNSTANNNAVLVTGAGSVWNNNGNLTVGADGSGNTLTIANGGAVSNAVQSSNLSQLQNLNQLSSGLQVNSTADGVIGLNAGASNNAVTVTGAGSVWSASGLSVGYAGSGNSLTISNSGAVTTVNSAIGGASDQFSQQAVGNAGANNNAALVTGAGSVWSNSSFFVVGGSGSGNSLTVANGGQVDNNFLGLVGLNAGASNNAVTVTGAGSAWNNRGLGVGVGDQGNTLTIANGGTASDLFALVGYKNGASNNAVTVTGAGSVMNNSYLWVGYQDAGNTLTVANSGTVYSANSWIGGTGGLQVQLSPQVQQFNNSSNANNNAVLVTGPGSALVNSGNLTVGDAGVSNTLTIANGGAATVGGNMAVGAGNQVVATGGNLTVGGTFNNAGTVTQVSGQGTFSSTVNAGTWQTSGGVTNTFGGAGLINTGAIQMGTGDVFAFNNTKDGVLADFVNLSTNPTGYDTTHGEFLFQGSANQTQDFATAGVDLGAGLTPGQKYTADMFGAGNSANNFGLGVLDLAAGTTLEVTDANPLDGQRAALYLNDIELSNGAKLIVDPNVTVYYYGSEGINAANVTLLGDGALRQLVNVPLSVPEPSSLMLLGLGGVALLIVRRRQK